MFLFGCCDVSPASTPYLTSSSSGININIPLDLISLRRSQKTARISLTCGNMDPSWVTDPSRAGYETSERRGRSSHIVPLPDHQRPSAMMAHLSPMEIEEEILRSSELPEHHAAVLLYLRLDIWLLESIYALRNSGWNELAHLHPTLFGSPPESLFNLIYTLRLFFTFDLASTIEKIEAFNHSGKRTDRSRDSNIKLAPRGQAYGCPSKHCQKKFIKSGHAANHVEKQHPEYLKLHPDYQPSHFMVADRRSGPTSPELDRQERQRPNSKQRELKPNPLTDRSVSAAPEGLPVYFNEGPGGNWDHPSPRVQGYDSPGDTDEAPRLVPSRDTLRTASHSSTLHLSTQQNSYRALSPQHSRYIDTTSHAKRARDLTPSSEPFPSADANNDADLGRFRRYAKRRSIIDCY